MAIVKQTNITIFAKPAFLNVKPSRPFKYEGKVPHRGHLMRISSITRGEQIANFIGAKLNPTDGYQEDICIYVKPPHKPGQDFLFEGKKAYLDIQDAPGCHDLLKNHPEVTVIAASNWMYEVLKKTLPNKIVIIPEHHCNFERLRRTRKEIATVGCIGTSGSFKYMPKDIKERLAARGIKFIEFSKIFTRQDVVDFYSSIDIQIMWRPQMNSSKNQLRNPLKIINASSFGIPTIMYEEPSSMEMDGCFIPIHSLDEFLTQLDKLRSDPKLYDQYAKRCIEKSEEYHIEKIAQLYKNLAIDDQSPKDEKETKVINRNVKRPPWYSTYEENNYGELFYSLMRIYQPELVVELGTKGGFSAYHIARGLNANQKGKLYCYDLWEHYEFYKVAKKNLREFENIVNLEIRNAQGVDQVHKTVDILHVDLGNQGETLEKIVPLWIDKVRQLIIIEGGSRERDERGWMIKNKAVPIRNWLEDFSRRRTDIEYFTIEPFPSVTIIRKK